MQALTAARSAVTGINKEMISIKKNISELRLKQQQQQAVRQSSADPGVVPTTPGSMDLGHSSLDDIFKSAASIPVDLGNEPTYDPNMMNADIDRATGILDDVIGMQVVNKYTQHETENPTTVVLIGDSDDDVEYATYNDNGELLDDYPNPTTDITEINREAGYAKDALLRTYALRKK